MSELWQRVNVYRLAKRNGEIILQELWSKAFSDGETEWRDKPTIDLPPVTQTVMPHLAEGV